MALLDPEEKTGQRGPRVVLVCPETPVLSGHPERRVNLECLDCPGTQEDKGQRDLKASRASQVPTEKREHGERLESLDHVDREDQQVHEEREGQEGQQAKLDQRATQEMMAHQDLRVKGDFQVLKGRQASQDLRGLRDPQGKTDFLGILDREARLDFKERPARLVPLVLSDLRDQLGRLDRWATEDTLDRLVLLVNKVYLEPQGKKELKVTPDLPVQLAKTVHLDQEVSLESEVCPALWGLMV